MRQIALPAALIRAGIRRIFPEAGLVQDARDVIRRGRTGLWREFPARAGREEKKPRCTTILTTGVDTTSGDRQSRYEEADDGRQTLRRTPRTTHANTPRTTHAAYAEADHGHGRYQDDHQHYDEAPERRSRLVPILTIVAAVLIVAIGVVAALYFLGVFDSSGRPAASVSTSTERCSHPRCPADLGPAVRSVGGRIRAGRPGR